MKRTLVTLQVGEWLQDFEIDHAERLLAMPDNGGWHLPADSDYQFDKENGITRKRTQKAHSATPEEGNASTGDSAPAAN